MEQRVLDGSLDGSYWNTVEASNIASEGAASITSIESSERAASQLIS